MKSSTTQSDKQRDDYDQCEILPKKIGTGYVAAKQKL